MHKFFETSCTTAPHLCIVPRDDVAESPEVGRNGGEFSSVEQLDEGGEGTTPAGQLLQLDVPDIADALTSSASCST